MTPVFSKNKILPITLHVLAWLTLVILPQLIINRFWGNTRFVAWEFYFNASVYGLIFYLNYLWLVPRYFLNDRKVLYFLLASLTIILLYFFSGYISAHYIHDPAREKAMADVLEKLGNKRPPRRGPFREMQVYFFILLSILVTGFSLGLKVLERHSASEKRQKELEKEKLNSELAFLKNQISPHFFFNTLNNIYSLIEISKSDAQEAVLKLSKMMRYLLYESEQGKIQLRHEIGFMRNYIDLMKLRLSDKVELKVDFPEAMTDDQIPPLLFIPFIENAFKHGVSYRGKSFIRISLTKENSQVKFLCANSMNKRSDPDLVDNHSGIGLENVKKRLKLLFPENHTLVIRESDDAFEVDLEINLI
ncbi:MAG TPA: histidine kinase [Prolixibacteraceae bacterium]|nr:histidine kinase [Prolixibacteraceae bacterium]